ncbi:metallophosphoesterase family protein [Bacteroidota bacterium]
MDRRKFMIKSSLIMAGSSLSGLEGVFKTPVIRFGMVADPHYAETDPLNSSNRYYKHSDEKLEAAISLFNAEKLDFIIELGDFKDQDAKPNKMNTLRYLRDIEKVFTSFDGPRYHVLGNHDMDSISKKEFQENVENTGISKEEYYYSFDQKDFHFVVLDANFTKSGRHYSRGNFDWTDSNINPRQLKWLKNDLANTDKPTIVFVHHRLDTPHAQHKIYCIRNASKVRAVLEKSGKVAAVFHGHDHEGDYSSLNGIHYFTQYAMVSGPFPENNSYSIVEIFGNGDIRIDGYVNCQGRVME